MSHSTIASTSLPGWTTGRWAIDPARSTVTAVVELSSVNTGMPACDDHLRSGDFKDVTRPVELTVEYLGVDPTGMQGEPRIGFEATTTIHRGDFIVSFGPVADGSKVPRQ